LKAKQKRKQKNAWPGVFTTQFTIHVSGKTNLKPGAINVEIMYVSIFRL